MSDRRPVIGVTGPDHGGLAGWLFTAIAIYSTKGKPVRITPGKQHAIGRLDGLILGGGADIDPGRYGDSARNLKQELSKKNTSGFSLLSLILYPVVFLFRKLLSTKQYTSLDKARDTLEFDLLKSAVSRPIPVLGICRGAQLINVHFGGTLYQDISEFYVESPQVWSVFPRKQVEIQAASRLFRALQDTECCLVNALHKQAIKEPGENISIAASEPNRVIQAVEHATLPFVVGVQWHPEYLFMLLPSQRNLFRTLVKMSSRAM